MPQKYKKFPIQDVLNVRGMVIDFTELSNDKKNIIIHLKRDLRFKNSYCSICGRRSTRERKIKKIVRDLPISGKETYLSCEIYNVKCTKCGIRREKLDFVDNHSRQTIRLETYIFELVSMSTVTDVADKFSMSWETVKNIDKKYLEARFKTIDYGNLKQLSIDEIANKKGHNYLSVVMDLETGRVIWVGEGRKEEDIDKFYQTLTKKQKKNIEAISIDMWPAYINAAKKNCPNADIIFDKFHIVKKFGEVITKLRSAEYQKAEDKKNKDILKGTKWLLLKNKSNLKLDAKKELKNLLELNENLATAYILKEKLSSIWKYKSITWCKKAINEWIDIAEESNIRGIKAFIKMLRKHEYGILNYCKYPISNGKIEGTNNKIKVLKRRSYGFHDIEYFKLKILESCQGRKGG